MHSSSPMNIDKAISYHYGQFPPRGLDYTLLVPQLVKAADAIARYDEILKTMHSNEIFLAPLRNQEAVISSRMEGTVSTMDEILWYQADFGEDPEESRNVRSEVAETYLYQRALKLAQEAIKQGQPLTSHLLKAIHARLLLFGRGASKSPGKFKVEQNYIVDGARKNILFVPITPEKLQDGIDLFFQYINSAQDIPLIKTAISHVEFEALHPFKDGNGRIGRMLITLLLWTSGVISAPHFYISAYFEEHKDAYIDTLRAVSSSNDWTAWCLFFLEAIEHQAKQNLQVATSIRDLYEEMKETLPTLLASKWSIHALDFVFTNPVFRNNKFTNESGIPASSAAQFTKKMLKEGLLDQIGEPSGRRPALYRFEPLMRLVRV